MWARRGHLSGSDIAKVLGMLLPTVAILTFGCTNFAHTTQRIELKKVSQSAPSANSALVKFRRGNSESVVVGLTWEPDTDPIYSTRGKMREIILTEAGHSVVVSGETIRAKEALHMIEDLWPEYVELHSETAGDYDLSLPFGVPAGAASTLVRFRDYKFGSAISVISAGSQTKSEPERYRTHHEF